MGRGGKGWSWEAGGREAESGHQDSVWGQCGAGGAGQPPSGQTPDFRVLRRDAVSLHLHTRPGSSEPGSPQNIFS